MTPATKAEAARQADEAHDEDRVPRHLAELRRAHIRPDDLVGNIARAQKFDNDYRMARIERPANRGEWLMPPQTVNAYYAPGTNEIVFPAAMLQPPYFNAAADDAVNYGGIGAVIGHEIGHALDDRGRHIDGTALRATGGGHRTRRRTVDGSRSSSSSSAPSVPSPAFAVNGALTLGENSGDLAGLAIAYRAYQLSRGGKPAPVIDGLSGDQRFFMGWAQIWRAKERDEYLRQMSLQSAYAPARFRANGPVSHLPAFYEAFGLKAGDGLYRLPGDRVRIW